MLQSLRLQNFRSYKDEQFEFGAGVNIIVGPNASGKTNLLEAILVVYRGNSYRNSDKELVAHHKPWARLEAIIENQPRQVKLEDQGERVAKSYVIGADKLQRLSPERTLPVVVFEPSHLQLLTESPDLRRGFLDDVIEQTIPAFSSLRRQYKRTLSQRNSLLRQGGSDKELFVWDVRLSELGGRIAEQRLRYVKNNRALLKKLYNRLVTKRSQVDLTYESRLPTDNYGSAMLKALEANKTLDRERGFTTVGPHRDDLVPLIANYPLAQAASRGETRTMLLALKLLEIQSVEKARGIKPILLLDDVFSELDGSRRRALTEHLKDHQTFITTTDADIVVQHFLDNCTIIPTRS